MSDKIQEKREIIENLRNKERFIADLINKMTSYLNDDIIMNLYLTRKSILTTISFLEGIH